jgi:hypothetical protein
MPLFLLPLSLLLAPTLPALSAPGDLLLRGYTVIPTPQRVSLDPEDIRLDATWTLSGESGISARTLTTGLAEFHGLHLKSTPAPGPHTILLAIREGAAPGAPAETRAQGYRLTIRPDRIEITGNGPAGLFYGVQTLIQLAKSTPLGTLSLPQGVIEDWPQLALRFLHWDTKHHQDRLPTLKRYLDWAARFKANMIGFELEDKFSYPSNPIIGAPGAFTPAELQELVDYGLERFIQIVPVVQSPAHMAYVLKHPQFAHLRADGNNYMSCLCLEDTYKLIFQMYDDLIAATRGIDYFFVSTDEIYYAGIGANCKQPYTPESRSAHWADFAIRARNHLAGKGRRMLAWLEYPLLAKDLDRIPADVIDGVVGDESFVEIEKHKGMRQLAYTSLQGAEFLFPDHFAIESLPAGAVMGEFEAVHTAGRLSSTHASIARGRALSMNPIGVFGAAWDDSGLHNETFWLGWSAAARWAWHPGTPGPEQHAAEFMHIYYGPQTSGMIEIYRSLQRQARAWQRTWDRVVSRTRAPGYGNSDGKGLGTARQDLTLTPPPLPNPETLAFQPAFATRYRNWIAEAPAQHILNDQLQHALLDNFPRASRNQYNLEVFLALARFTGHHWTLFSSLAAAEQDLVRASAAAADNRPSLAVGHLVAAHNRIARLEQDAAAVHRHLARTFEKSRLPKGLSLPGRPFIHILDDTKDHWADRTPDLGYMFAPERSLQFPEWRTQLAKITQNYAAHHKIPVQGLATPRLED